MTFFAVVKILNPFRSFFFGRKKTLLIVKRLKNSKKHTTLPNIVYVLALKLLLEY